MVITVVICDVDQGGRHVDYVTDQIITKLLDVVKRKEKKAGVTIKPFQVTSALHVVTLQCVAYFLLEVVKIMLIAFFCNFCIYFLITV